MRYSVLVIGIVFATAGPAPGQVGNYGMAPRGETFVEEPPDLKWETHFGEQVPLGLRFQDEHGKQVTLGGCMKGKPTILVLAYYRCPKLCNQVLNGLLEAVKKIPMNLGEDYQIVTVSFDPKEQPALALSKKANYVDQYGRSGASEGWKFLTGDKPEIDRLCEAVGFEYLYDEREKFYIHPSGVMILTEDGKISRYLFGQMYNPTSLRVGLYESSDGEVGSIAEGIWLRCMHYDPDTGDYKYNLGRMILMIAAVPAVLVVGFIVLTAVRGVPPANGHELN